MNIDKLCWFIRERESIRIKRSEGEPPPWTEDTVLQTYRFCNVHREDDKVTKYIKETIREPFAEHPNLWFMLCIARQINWPNTLAELMSAKGNVWPKNKWDPESFRYVLLDRAKRKEQVYTGAYMLNCVWSSDYTGPRDKPAFTTYKVLNPLWQFRTVLEPKLRTTLKKAHAALTPYIGWGSFMAAQVIADLKYTRYLEHAEDWWDWAASGPGSRRGLNVVLGRDAEEHWKEEDWLTQLQELREKVVAEGHTLHAQDLQNCLCEYFKYCRGWSRSKYRYENHKGS